jgi:(2Fe-2S) ferredoxin
MTEVSEFCLEGRFLDFVIKDGYKLKGLQLETAEGECYIKLAKHLRAAFDLRLPPGTWLQVVGEKKQDMETGEVKLKAERVMAAPNQRDREIGATPLQEPLSFSNGKLKTATILVCQKSDCMKRGGKEVCQALEAALSDRDLESQVTIKGTGCMKNCKAGPNLVMPDKTRHSRVQREQVPALMDKHFAANRADNKQDKKSEVAVPIAMTKERLPIF